MTQSHPFRHARTLGAGLAACALIMGTAGPAAAAPDLPDPVGSAGAEERPSIEEQLESYGDSVLPDRWLVEVDGAAVIEGGSAANAQRTQDGVVAAAQAEGLDVSVTANFSSAWNGVAVTASTADAEKLARLSGVAGVYPVLLVDQPAEPAARPDIDYARLMTGADVANEELGVTGAGIKVGIIDSGIDYNHPDFGGSGVNDETADFPGPRVKWGYDYVGDAYDASSDDPAINTPMPDAWPDDCGGHGTHVAGIVGANGGVTGVAPEVEFGAYRIFGCDGSSDSEVIMEAMEQAHADGMDIINMSLGASLQTWSSYPTAVLADRLVDAGIVVVVSQGNAGDLGTFTGGAPSVAHNVISVGSVDNLQYMADYIATAGGVEAPYMTSTGSPNPEPGSTFTLVAPEDPLICEAAAVPPAEGEGQALLVSRGVCSFHIKAMNAQAAGYDAVIVANNTGGVINMTVEGDPEITIPAVSILQADGAALLAEITASEAGSTTITFSEEPKRFDNPTGGYQATTSSWGLAADLTLKPDVSAPGGSIYSTYPLEVGGYATLGGTSMAAPHVAGAAALMLEANPGLDPYQVRTILTNTANPFTWGLIPGAPYLEPVARQGAGMIDIPHALTTTSYVQPQKISLGDSDSGPDTFEISVYNGSDSEVTYELGVEHGVAAYGPPDAIDYYLLDADVSFTATSITVPAHSTGTAQVTITEDFGADGAIYGGWITLTAETEQLVVPFAGLSGDYQALTVLEFAALVYANETGGLAVAEPFHTYTMVGTDFPTIALYLAYPTSALYVDIYQANEDGTKGRKVHSNFINYASLLDLGRFSALSTLPWDGTYQGNNGNGKLRRVGNGDYVLELRVLKPLGDPNNAEHWEIWNSVAFTIEYGEGADTSAGVGPEPKRDNPNKGPGNNNGRGPNRP
ncbi:MAG: S8 family serine peptidase [bacterium]|nr:S8 family serine peptidase [bacterium]